MEVSSLEIGEIGENVELSGSFRYAETHEWAKREEDGSIRVGISDFAQDQLGDLVFVELPDLDIQIERGEAFSEVESTKSVSEIYAPISGRVVARNEALLETPELINSDPYGDGWIVAISPEEDENIDHLLSSAEYEATLE